jgi:hypothetical protein
MAYTACENSTDGREPSEHMATRIDPARREKLEREAAGLICRGCGRADYLVRSVSQTYRVDNNTVTVTTLALVSEQCGDTILDDEASQTVDRAVQSLRNGTHAGLLAIGIAYRYAGEGGVAATE